MTFTELGLAAPILSALAAKGYDTPTPIQIAAIPHVMAGSDLLGLAQTGTGKTAAFALPVLHRFLAKPRKAEPKTARALVLAPTRELAAQIAASFQNYSKGMRLRVAVVFGGVPINRQMRAMDPGVDVLVATPGRLLDLINQRGARLDRVDTLILDEADHMLDLGFILPLKKIRAMLPKERQTLLFSATMPKEIAALAEEFLTNPVRVEASPVASTPERVAQRVIQVSSHGAKQAELQTLLSGGDVTRALVFTRTKHGADRVVQKLYEAGIDAHAIHGNKKQNHRERALEAFRSGRTRVLVATDIAARGIDVAEISHVVQYDLPEVAETYVHRIGRTARAGHAGQAIALCAPDENSLLRAAERLMGISVTGPRPEGDHPYQRPKPRPRPAGSTQARGPRPPQRARTYQGR
jgi:ATP-dependent RNA helicase RhlE